MGRTYSECDCGEMLPDEMMADHLKECREYMKKLHDDKRFQVAKDLFTLYRSLQRNYVDDDAKYAINDADIFMQEFTKESK